MSAFPSDELVLVSWLRTLPDLPSGVATALPADSTTWPASGFITVTGAGGGMGVHVPMAAPVLSVDTWAAPLHGDRPPWPVASKLIELIVWQTYTHPAPGLVTMPSGYSNAYLHSVYPLGRPRRVLGDPGGYAHMSCDIALSWNVAVNVA